MASSAAQVSSDLDQDEPETIEKDAFSLTIPSGWIAATPETVEVLNEETRRLFPDIDRKLETALSQGVELYAFDLKDPARNLNVNVTDGQIKVEERHREKATNALKQQIESMGIRVEDLRSSIVEVGGTPMFRFDYRTSYPGVGELHQVQWIAKSGKKIVCLTLSTPEKAGLDGLIDEILASYRVDPKKGIPFWLRGAIIGGIAAAGGAFFAGRKKKNQEAAATSDEFQDLR